MIKKYLLTIICALSMSAFATDILNQSTSSETRLLVHKTPTCGCCKQWVKHIKNNGFIVDTKDHQNLEDIKNTYKIEPQYRSCHTAVSSDGFIFEGHIPSKYIAQFLTENHTNAIGLSVPGMPLGSPGMEVGDRFTPYKVLILFKDGTSEIYGEVNEK
tara:strand:- start:804 stop:1277 length:474 start_codon:yes stop_codon:yes gene_type:complete